MLKNRRTIAFAAATVALGTLAAQTPASATHSYWASSCAVDSSGARGSVSVWDITPGGGYRYQRWHLDMNASRTWYPSSIRINGAIIARGAATNEVYRTDTSPSRDYVEFTWSGNYGLTQKKCGFWVPRVA